MRLIRAEIHGYKRFEEVSVNLDGKVIALVGPNESGKSSLLEALAHIDVDDPFEPRQLTRGVPLNDEPVVAVRYTVDKEDLDAIADIPGTENIRWYKVSRDRQGKKHHNVDPIPPRQHSTLAAIVQSLNRVLETASQDGTFPSEEDSELHDFESNIRSYLDFISDFGQSRDERDFTSQEIESTRELASEFMQFTEELPEDAQKVAKQLEVLATEESAPPPGEVAADRLWNLSPDFVLFDEDSRSLKAMYPPEDLEGSIPVALANLCDLAKLSLSELTQAQKNEDIGVVEHIIEEANGTLGRFFSEAWRQSNVIVRLRFDGDGLHILVSTEPTGYRSIAERSAGLREFVALVSYMARRDQRAKPILLIDEAELHLHYDAQADLVRMFGRQTAAAKVIYTTHSAGCLPQDLGTGIRVIVPRVGQERSLVRNSFWSEGPGLMPLMLGMGATAFSFSSARYAVMGEGGSDAVLLPSLLREVSGREELGFQVVPGLSEVTTESVTELDRQGGRVTYLVDSDDGGREIASKLRQGGIPNERILELGLRPDVTLTLEDTLNLEVYLDAVNEELRRSHGAEVAIRREDIPVFGRSASVAEACSRQGVPSPNKVAVASRVLDVRGSKSLVSPNHIEHLRAVLDAIDLALDMPR